MSAGVTRSVRVMRVAKFTLVGANGKRYRYRIVTKSVTGPSYSF